MESNVDLIHVMQDKDFLEMENVKIVLILKEQLKTVKSVLLHHVQADKSFKKMEHVRTHFVKTTPDGKHQLHHVAPTNVTIIKSY